MELNKNLIIGIFTVIGLLVGWGGSDFISGDIIDNTYVCSLNGNVAAFDKLSSTGVTGYYQNEDNERKGKQCRTVGWTPIADYAASQGVSIDSLIEQKTIETVKVRAPTGEEIIANCPNALPVVYDEYGNKYLCNKFGGDAECIAWNDILPI